jgi:hypothetical protein
VGCPPSRRAAESGHRGPNLEAVLAWPAWMSAPRAVLRREATATPRPPEEPGEPIASLIPEEAPGPEGGRQPVVGHQASTGIACKDLEGKRCRGPVRTSGVGEAGEPDPGRCHCLRHPAGLVDHRRESSRSGRRGRAFTALSAAEGQVGRPHRGAARRGVSQDRSFETAIRIDCTSLTSMWSRGNLKVDAIS